MDLVKKIRDLCEGKNTNFAALERELSFGQGTIRKWDNSSPSVDKLQSVADHFNVSIDYLLGREKSPAEAEHEDEDIIILNRGAKKMTPEQRKKLLEVAKVMFEEEFQ